MSVLGGGAFAKSSSSLPPESVAGDSPSSIPPFSFITTSSAPPSPLPLLLCMRVCVMLGPSSSSPSSSSSSTTPCRARPPPVRMRVLSLLPCDEDEDDGRCAHAWRHCSSGCGDARKRGQRRSTASEHRSYGTPRSTYSLHVVTRRGGGEEGAGRARVSWCKAC